MVFLYTFIKKNNQSGTKELDFHRTSVCLAYQKALKGLIWLANACKRSLSLNAGCRKILKKNKRTTVEESQEARAKESHWARPLQPLLYVSPWSIVLPLLQVGLLQIVITAQSQIFQRIQQTPLRVRFGPGDATKGFYTWCQQLSMFQTLGIYKSWHVCASNHNSHEAKMLLVAQTYLHCLKYWWCKLQFWPNTAVCITVWQKQRNILHVLKRCRRILHLL